MCCICPTIDALSKKLHSQTEHSLAAPMLAGAACLLIRRTEIKKQQDTSQQLEKLQTEDDIARRDFIADVSHELKKPAAILAGAIEVIEDGIHPLTSGSISSPAADLKISNKIIENLFEPSLAGFKNPPHTFQDTYPIIATDTAINSVKIKNYSSPTQCSHPDIKDQLLIPASSARIYQFISNMFKNSIRYTSTPGDIKILCSSNNGLTQVLIVEFESRYSNDQLELIFHRFYRAEGSRMGSGSPGALYLPTHNRRPQRRNYTHSFGNGWPMYYTYV